MGKARGAFDPTAPEVIAPAGAASLELRDGARVTATSHAVVEAGKTHDVVLAPEAKGAPGPSAPGDASEWRKPVGIAAIGLGVGLLALGAVSSAEVHGIANDFSSDPAFVRYRQAPHGAEANVCDGADANIASPPGAAGVSQVHDRCSSLSTFRTLQWVGYGAGAAFVVGGALLVATSGEGPSRRARPLGAWRLLPSFGPSSAAFAVRADFLSFDAFCRGDTLDVTNGFGGHSGMADRGFDRATARRLLGRHELVECRWRPRRTRRQRRSRGRIARAGGRGSKWL